MRTVWIVQSYVPRHRVALFEQLIDRLAGCGVSLRVAAGNASDADQADRNDEVRPPWLEHITWRRLGPARISHARHLCRAADAVIFPHEGSNLELSAALAARTFGRAMRVGVWGHLRNYVNDPHPLDAAVERWQLRRADKVFAYTARGASFAAAAGVTADRIVTLNNTIDTSSLRSAIESLDPLAVREFQARHHLDPRWTVAYIGGLDGSKRIDFLTEVLDLLWEPWPDIKLLVAGHGRFTGLLDRAIARGQVVRLGYADAHTKALIAASAQMIVNPGRTGLLAVDALAMGLPIVTTPFAYHAPEVEYLVEGRTVHTSQDETESFAKLIVDRLREPVPVDIEPSEIPQMSDLVQRFSTGIVEMLQR